MEEAECGETVCGGGGGCEPQGAGSLKCLHANANAKERDGVQGVVTHLMRLANTWRLE